MKKIVTLLLMLCLLPMSLFAQTPASPTLAEMKKLDFLVGQWQGEGYFLLGPSQRKTFSQTENIQRKVDGTILHIEGLGKSKDPGNEGTTIHNVFGIVSYDKDTKVYRWRVYRADGSVIDTEAKVSGNTLVWGMRERGADIRFTITLNEKGQWIEIGEFSRDGKTWQKFFEMTLRRVA